MDKVEYRAVIKFLTKQGKSPKVMRKEMLLVYGDLCPAEATIKKWSREFRCVRTSIEYKPRQGRPVEATTAKNVEKIEKVILNDVRLRKKQLAEMTGISETSILKILHEHPHVQSERKVRAT